MSNLDCPVDFVKVDENRVRIIALFVMLLSVIFIFTYSPYIPAFLVIDFFLRTANLGKYSLLAVFAGLLTKTLRLSIKPTDRAPKRFAAGTGMVITSIALVFVLFNIKPAAIVLALLLIVFSSLESFAGWCAGCFVYSRLRMLGLFAN